MKHRIINDDHDYIIASSYHDKYDISQLFFVGCLCITNKGTILCTFDLINFRSIENFLYEPCSVLNLISSCNIGDYFAINQSDCKLKFFHDHEHANLVGSLFQYFGIKSNTTGDLIVDECCLNEKCESTSLTWRMGSLICPNCKKYYGGI